jgi:hypothetical protein
MSLLKVAKLQGITATGNEITIPATHKLIVSSFLKTGTIQSSGGISVWSADNSGNISTGANITTAGSIIVKNVSVTTSGRVNLPVWTTGTRPASSLVVGRIGYNSTLSDIDVWSGSTWVNTITPTAEFSTAYQTLISSFVGTKYYVATNGSNSNNGTSALTPWASIDYATSTAVTGSMIIIATGDYYKIFNGQEDAYVGTTGIRDYSKALTIVAAPGRTRLYIYAPTANCRDLSAYGCLNASTKVYGLTFIRDNGGRTTQYSNAFFGWAAGEGGNSVRGELYNCAFREINSNGYWGLHYDNGNIAAWKAYNCTFLGANWQGNYSGGTSTLVSNCVSNTTYAISGTNTGSVYGQNFYGNYNYSSSPAAGVYSGTYAWQSSNTTISIA